MNLNLLSIFWKKVHYIIILLILCNLNLWSQNKISIISGIITNNNGKAIASVRIAINELRKQTFTNNSGKFKLENIPYCNYN